jgi:hypothetical protein
VNATTNCVGGFLRSPGDVGFDFSALWQVDGSIRFLDIEQNHRRVEIGYTWTDLEKLRALERERLASG